MSGLWGVLIAPSATAVREAFPELDIVEILPAWFDEDDVAQMRETALWLDDDPPQGLPSVVVTDRARG